MRRIISAGLVLLSVLASSAGLPAQETEDADWRSRLVDYALERTQREVRYDGSYRSIGYPGGDVPDDVGVCTDLVVRAYRSIGVDLQREVHEDMSAAFHAYPRIWGLTRPDPNIDHRRVPNLQTFFSRKGRTIPASMDPADYLPGDIVTWRLPAGLPHIGLVAGLRSGGGERPLVVHNIGRGPELEDCLFRYEITGHFRFSPVDARADR